MRGRLIQKFYARVVRLDREATRFDENGYDDDFREPSVANAPRRDNVGELVRREMDPILVPCQIDPKQREEDGMRMLSGGQSPTKRMFLVFHFRDLENLGLVADGNAVFTHGDRLDAVLLRDKTTVAYTVATPPGLYLASSTPIGWGISMRSSKRNLLLVEFAERRTATQRFE